MPPTGLLASTELTSSEVSAPQFERRKLRRRRARREFGEELLDRVGPAPAHPRPNFARSFPVALIERRGD